MSFKYYSNLFYLGVMVVDGCDVFLFQGLRIQQRVQGEASRSGSAVDYKTYDMLAGTTTKVSRSYARYRVSAKTT